MQTRPRVTTNNDQKAAGATTSRPRIMSRLSSFTRRHVKMKSDASSSSGPGKNPSHNRSSSSASRQLPIIARDSSGCFSMSPPARSHSVQNRAAASREKNARSSCSSSDDEIDSSDGPLRTDPFEWQFNNETEARLAAEHASWWESTANDASSSDNRAHRSEIRPGSESSGWKLPSKAKASRQTETRGDFSATERVAVATSMKPPNLYKASGDNTFTYTIREELVAIPARKIRQSGKYPNVLHAPPLIAARHQRGSPGQRQNRSDETSYRRTTKHDVMHRSNSETQLSILQHDHSFQEVPDLPLLSALNAHTTPSKAKTAQAKGNATQSEESVTQAKGKIARSKYKAKEVHEEPLGMSEITEVFSYRGPSSESQRNLRSTALDTRRFADAAFGESDRTRKDCDEPSAEPEETSSAHTSGPTRNQPHSSANAIQVPRGRPTAQEYLAIRHHWSRVQAARAAQPWSYHKALQDQVRREAADERIKYNRTHRRRMNGGLDKVSDEYAENAICLACYDTEKEPCLPCRGLGTQYVGVDRCERCNECVGGVRGCVYCSEDVELDEFGI